MSIHTNQPSADISDLTGTSPYGLLLVDSTGTVVETYFGSAGQILVSAGSASLPVWTTPGGGIGTVTSVALTLPAEFSIAGSPVTTTGTLAGSWASQSPNLVFASPSSGSGTPGFRSLVAADIPSTLGATTISGALIVTGNLTINGTTTTINSTVVEVEDRVIRVNKTPGPGDPVPSAIAGLAIYRGDITGTPRDAYGLFWDESTSLWKLAVNTGADDATLGAYLNLRVAALTASSITTAGQITSTIATGTAPFVVASTTLVSNLYGARAALADTVTTNANLTGPITSSGNATSVASQTGTGSTFVMNTSPTLVTPTLGAATATSLASGTLSASGVITSTLATGTAPFTVASTTLVSNLYSTRAALADTVTTNANLTGPITSTGNATTFVSQLNAMFEAPTAKTYTLVYKTEFACTINELEIVSGSGTLTAAFKINGTNITGLSAVGVTSVTQTVTASGANTMVAGDTLTMVVSSPVSPVDVVFTIKYTR